MIRTDRRMRLCICLVIANLAFIWGNSLLSATASKALSDWLHGLLSGLFAGNAGSGSGGGSGLLRKIAHFMEFCSLGMLLGWLFAMEKRSMLWPLVCAVAAAGIDEGLQFLAPERGPGLRDVCIDSAGAAAGIALLLFGHYVSKKIRSIIHSGGK